MTRFSLTTMTSETKGAFIRYTDLFIFLEVKKYFNVNVYKGFGVPHFR